MPDPTLVAAIRTLAAEPASIDGATEALGALVAIRSGTGDADGVGRVAGRLATALRELGAEVELRPDGPAGPTLVAVLRGMAPGSRVALIGHLDTVGAPDDPDPVLTVRDGRASGRGAVDMKGGL